MKKSMLESQTGMNAETVPRPENPYASVQLMSRLAEKFGVRITEQDEAFWEAILRTTRVLDDLVDDEKADQIDTQLDSLLRGEPIDRITAEAAQKIAASFALVGGERSDLLYQEIASLPFYAQMQAESTVYTDYRDINRAEASMFARIIAVSIDDNAPDALQRRNFNQWLEAFSTAAYAYDNFVDGKKDYESGVNPLKPGLKATVLLAGTALKDIARFIEVSPISVYPTIASVQSKRYLGRLRKLTK